MGYAIVIFAIGYGMTFLFEGDAKDTAAILTVTTLGILFSLVPAVNSNRKSFQLGMYFIYVFCVIVASKANLKEIFDPESAELLMYISIYIAIAMVGSLFLHSLLSKIFGITNDDFIITSTALANSPPFVPVVAAASEKQGGDDSGMIIGVIGYAVGNYLGGFHVGHRVYRHAAPLGLGVPCGPSGLQTFRPAGAGAGGSMWAIGSTDVQMESRQGDVPPRTTSHDAWLLIDNDLIADYGNGDLPKEIDQTIDAGGGTLLPAFCDSHTHLVYAGSREEEYTHKIMGLSYEEIARRGGGILNSAKLLQGTSEEELFSQSVERAHEIISLGTGAVEIKSGYGLTTKDEIKNAAGGTPDRSGDPTDGQNNVPRCTLLSPGIQGQEGPIR
jgi:hypothetical protein